MKVAERSRFAAGTTRPELRAPRPFGVKIFALLGAVSLGVIIQGWTRWLLSGPSPSPRGSDEVSGLHMAVLRMWEVTFPVVALYIIWRFLVRPLIRERSFGFDGMFIIAGFVAWFYDPVTTSWGNLSFAYNAHHVQYGSWANYIPFWSVPNGERFVEPIFTLGGLYLWFVFAAALLGCAILRGLSARYPRMGALQMLSVLFLLWIVIDLVLENLLFIRFGIWSYPFQPRSITLWADTRYQFPIHEAVFTGVFSTALGALRYYRNDRGQCVAERGVDQLRLPSWGRKLVSFLAITGCVHAIILGLFAVPFSGLALKANTNPPVPSYIRQGLCGAGTQYACPSQFVPIPRPGSLHVGPDDPRLPQWLRERQGMKTAGE